MPVEHEVAQGECLSSIADRYGIFPETIWNDPDNAELKRSRQDPNVLCPGDVLVIPDKRQKSESVASGQACRFRKKNTPAKLRVRLLDEDDRPRANLRYTLEIDGVFSDGATDGDGRIDHPVPAGAKKGVLVLENQDTIELSLGALDPPDTVTGVQGRLMNLGFDCGGVDGEMNAATREALKAFQEKQGLAATGEADDATKDKLRQVHGS